MKNLSDLNKKLIPLVRAYARDMKVLIVDDEKTNIEFYTVAFGKFFNICDVAYNGQEALNMWNKDKNYYDLIVTDLEMPQINGLELVQEIREHSMEQSIIIITGITDIDTNQDIAYYYIDGLLPKPINNKKLYPLLYRVLKKISEKKEYDFYIKDIERQLNEAIEFRNHFKYIIKKLEPIRERKEAKDVIAMLKTLLHKQDNIIFTENDKIKKQKTQIPDKAKNDLRTTFNEKISALEFNETLDDTIIDKIEEFNGVLDNFCSILYSVEDESSDTVLQNIPKINRYLDEFLKIIVTLVTFPIIERSFNNLIHFLENLNTQNIQNEDSRKMLIVMLLSIEKDLQNWINTVFIDQNTDDVHYFDASFSNNILEIESVLNNEIVDDDDEDDLEFF